MRKKPGYNKFSEYLKSKYGERIQRIAVNAGFGCPNIDGTISTEGCIFCNNRAFSHSSEAVPLEIQIEKGIEYAKRRYGAEKFILYFQPFTNTYGPIELLREKYNVVKKYDSFVALSIGTRPDCISKSVAELLHAYKKYLDVWVELGLQSKHDVTLKEINRGHNYEAFLKAVKILTDYDLKIWIHVILGLPGEGKKEIVETAKALSSLPVTGVKIHPLHVVKGTTLEKMYINDKYKPMSKREYIDYLISFIECLRDDIIIDRIGADVKGDLLVAPEWIKNKSELISEFEHELIKRDTHQGSKLS